MSLIAFMKRTVVCLIALALVYVVPTLAIPTTIRSLPNSRWTQPSRFFYWCGARQGAARCGPSANAGGCAQCRRVQRRTSPRAKSIPLAALPRRWPRSRVIFRWSYIEPVRTIWPVWPIRNCIALGIGTCKCSTRACQVGSSTSIRWKGRSVGHSPPSELGVATGCAGAFA